MQPLIQQFAVQALLLVVAGVLLARMLYLASRQLRIVARQQQHLVELVNRELPQTQCGQCGYEGCLPYARAIAQGEAINKCPPGGARTIGRLARLLNEADEALDPAHGQTGPTLVALVREDECIGCTKCIQACPVDAIVGAGKLMHTVIEAECTGCDLCVAPCPVDCIDMVLPSQSWQQGATGQRSSDARGDALPC